MLRTTGEAPTRSLKAWRALASASFRDNRKVTPPTKMPKRAKVITTFWVGCVLFQIFSASFFGLLYYNYSYFSIQLGRSSSQLTFTPSFFRGVGQPPTRLVQIWFPLWETLQKTMERSTMLFMGKLTKFQWLQYASIAFCKFTRGFKTSIFLWFSYGFPIKTSIFP